MFWERLLELCKEKNTKPNPVAASLKISSGAVTKWKNGTVPNGNTLQTLADYFGVSVDYLLGKSDERGQKESPTNWRDIEMSPEKRSFFEQLDKLSDEQIISLSKIIFPIIDEIKANRKEQQ